MVPALDQSVTEAEGGRGELVEDGRVDQLRVVAAESVAERQQTHFGHLLTAHHDGQPFVVGNVLHLADEDAARFLVQPLVVPVRIEVGQLFGQAVVLAHEDGVRHGQTGLLVGARVARFEALGLGAGVDTVQDDRLDALLLGIVVGRQQVQLAVFAARRHFEEAAFEGAQFVRLLVVAAVDVRVVQKVRQLVHLLAVAEAAVETRRRHAAHEAHAALAVRREERIVVGDVDGQTLGMDQQLAGQRFAVVGAAHDARAVGAHAEHGRRRQIVVDELAVLHHPQRARFVRVVDVGHHRDRHQTRARQLVADHRNPRTPNACTPPSIAKCFQ